MAITRSQVKNERLKKLSPLGFEPWSLNLKASDDQASPLVKSAWHKQTEDKHNYTEPYNPNNHCPSPERRQNKTGLQPVSRPVELANFLRSGEWVQSQFCAKLLPTCSFFAF